MELLQVLKVFANPYVIATSLLAGVLLCFVMFQILKKERDESLVYSGRTNSLYDLVGGDERPTYYDIDKSSAPVENIDNISMWYIDNIKELKKKRPIDSLAFIEREDGPVGAITQKALICSKTSMPGFIVRPKKRIKALSIKGPGSIAGKSVALISDVATTGFSIERAADIVQAHNAHVVAAVTILNRGGKGTEELFREKGVEFRFVSDSLDRQQPTQ